VDTGFGDLWSANVYSGKARAIKRQKPPYRGGCWFKTRIIQEAVSTEGFEPSHHDGTTPSRWRVYQFHHMDRKTVFFVDAKVGTCAQKSKTKFLITKKCCVHQYVQHQPVFMTPNVYWLVALAYKQELPVMFRSVVLLPGWFVYHRLALNLALLPIEEPVFFSLPSTAPPFHRWRPGCCFGRPGSMLPSCSRAR
jgi:hypothetical protein